MTLEGKSTTQQVFIVKNLRNNLLGLPAITQLQLIQQHQIDVIQKTIPDQFPQLFTGLGDMKEPYTIKMKPEAKPYSIYTSRNIPIPLRAKVQEELKRMESLRVISKVDVPTPWCAGMVVVPKGSGAVCICVDLKPLNENVLCTTGSPPTSKGRDNFSTTVRCYSLFLNSMLIVGSGRYR